MKKYIGTKLIEAKQMTNHEFAKEKYGNEKLNNPLQEGYKVKYSDDYVSWSPKEVFEAAYNDINICMNFGQAIEVMKIGKKVSRKGWNGKGMFILIVNEYSKEGITALPYISLKTVDNKIMIGWTPNQIDMLSNDWAIVE